MKWQGGVAEGGLYRIRIDSDKEEAPLHVSRSILSTEPHQSCTRYRSTQVSTHLPVLPLPLLPRVDGGGPALISKKIM